MMIANDTGSNSLDIPDHKKITESDTRATWYSHKKMDLVGKKPCLVFMRSASLYLTTFIDNLNIFLETIL